MESSPRPDHRLAQKVLPKPLYRALTHVFAQSIQGCMLVGGTALAGYYAGHRRSDDLDLFADGESAQRAAGLAVKSLASLGAKLENIGESAQYLEMVAELESHVFKVTVVVDENLFRVATPVALEKVHVVDLETLFKMKAATLVSRCAEKDLYDLVWLFARFPQKTFADLIALGAEIDGGVTGENMLASVGGTKLRKDACDFSLNASSKAGDVYAEIQNFRRELVKGLMAHLEDEPTPPLGALAQALERLRR